MVPGARVVQAVGELEEHDAHVVRHRHHELAHGLRLGGVAEGQPVELGDAVDERCDLVAELGANLLEREVGVLDDVVQQAAAITVSGRPSPAMISATAIGCEMYASPLLRSWPSCACSATACARSISADFPRGYIR